MATPSLLHVRGALQSITPAFLHSVARCERLAFRGLRWPSQRIDPLRSIHSELRSSPRVQCAAWKCSVRW